MQVSLKFRLNDTFIFRRWSRKSYAVFRSLGQRVHIARLSLSVAAVFASPHLDAQQTESPDSATVVQMDEVVISAQRTEAGFNETARKVEVFDAEEIQSLPVQSLDQLLDYAAEADIRSRGPLNVQSDISIRAGSFDQVMILLNGVNITDPQTGHHHLNIPVDISAIKRIEVLSGPGAHVFGPNAFSGAINIITGTSEARAVHVGLHGGQHGYGKATAHAAFKASNTRHFLAADVSRSDGYRDNTDFFTGSAFYQTSWRPSPRHQTHLQAAYNHKKFGANSFYTPVYPQQKEQVRTRFASIRHRFQWGNMASVRATAYWRRAHDRFQLFRHDAPDWYTHHNYHMTDVRGASAGITFPFSRSALTLGTEYRHEQIHSNVLGEPAGDTIPAPGEDEGFFTHYKARNNWSTYAEYVLEYRKLYAVSGVMAAHNREFSGNWRLFPGININMRLKPYLHWLTSANYGMRLPSFTDLFYEGPVNIGNPNLKPEETRSLETGVKLIKPAFTLHTTVFARKGKNIIDWAKQHEQDIWRTLNITTLNTFGTSVRAKVLIDQLWEQPVVSTVNLSYSYASQQKETEGHISRYALDYLRHKVNLRVYHPLLWGMDLVWTAPWQDRAGSFILYEDGQYGSETSYDPFWLVDARLSYSLKRLRIYTEANNLLNHQYYDTGNVIQPGRWIRVGITWNM